MKEIPKAKEPREYIAFRKIRMETRECPAYVFFAVDAFTQYAFHLGVEPDDSDETILKNIYKLTQDEEFLRFSTSGFTLVLEQYKHLSDRIQSILKPFDAKVMFDKPYNNMITKALL